MGAHRTPQVTARRGGGGLVGAVAGLICAVVRWGGPIKWT